MANKRFWKDVIVHTPLVQMTVLLIVLWLAFSYAVYWGESATADTAITTYGRALYWSVAAFSTAGIADMPKSEPALFFGGLWIVLGSLLYFGTIVATVTAYFMRPMLTPRKAIIEAIENALEQLDDLSIEELELLKRTTDSLIDDVEQNHIKHP